jgi:hypothetical protein
MIEREDNRGIYIPDVVRDEFPLRPKSVEFQEGRPWHRILQLVGAISKEAAPLPQASRERTLNACRDISRSLTLRDL